MLHSVFSDTELLCAGNSVVVVFVVFVVVGIGIVLVPKGLSRVAR